MTSTRGLGYKQDRPDSRDHAFSLHPAAALALPISASIDVATVEPKDQLATSSCVGNCWAQALRLAYLARGLVCPELSAAYVYRLARNIDGTNGDEGSYLRSGAAAVQRLGCAPEASWPLREETINDQVPFSAQHAGFDRKGSRRYYRIPAGDSDSVRRALAARLPVVGGWQVDHAFVEGDGRGLIDVQDQTSLAGGHAIAIVGYAADGTFTLINSWGPFFGLYGRFQVTEGFVESGTDLWALDTNGVAA